MEMLDKMKELFRDVVAYYEGEEFGEDGKQQAIAGSDPFAPVTICVNHIGTLKTMLATVQPILGYACEEREFDSDLVDEVSRYYDR